MLPSSPTTSVVADAGAITQDFFELVDTELDLVAELLADKHSARKAREQPLI